MRGRRHLLAAALCTLLATPAAALADADPPGSEWTPVETEPSTPINIVNTNEIGLERTADGVLHVLWVNDLSNGSEALIHSPVVGKKPAHPGSVGDETTLLVADPSASRSLNDNVDLVPAGSGLRALFSTTWPSSPIDGVLATSTSADGSTWTSPSPASATDPAQRSPVYAATGIGGAVGLDGTTYSAWGDSSPSGGGYHVGLSPSEPDRRFSPDCCEIDPGVGVDAVSGEVVVAANLSDTGITLRSLNAGTTTVVPKSDHAWTGQRTSISGRIGKPGVYVAWGTGDNMFNARPALWRVGAPKFKFLKHQFDAAHVGMAPAPQGRMWVYWDRNGKVYASRTNRSATKFGAIVKIHGALGSSTFYRLAGEGSLGTLDLFALTDVEGTLGWWFERITPGLTLDGDAAVKAGDSLVLYVTDAGEPVSGIGVRTTIGGKVISDTSNAQGKVSLKIPGDAKPGKEKAFTDHDPAYTPAKTKFKVK